MAVLAASKDLRVVWYRFLHSSIECL